MSEKEFDLFSDFLLSIVEGVHENHGAESDVIRITCENGGYSKVRNDH